MQDDYFASIPVFDSFEHIVDPAFYRPLPEHWFIGFTDVVDSGRSLYQTHCASCRGVDLEGQPNWRTPLPNGRLPAPPHDETGHTWHHPDGVLLRITGDGPAAVVGGGYESDMPAFGGILTDAEMRSILDYIKSTWPEREPPVPGRDDTA